MFVNFNESHFPYFMHLKEFSWDGFLRFHQTLRGVRGTKSAKSPWYNLTLWRVLLTVLQWKHNSASCVCCWVTCHYKRCKNIEFSKNDFMVNLFNPQQCKVCVPGFERNYIATNSAPTAHVTYKRCV